MRVDFTIYGEAMSKSRPRFNTTTGKVFTDNKTRVFENFCALSYGNNPSFLDRNIRVCMDFIFKVPKSYSKKKRIEVIEGKVRPKKKDLDNLAKSVFDGIQYKSFNNDSQVCELDLRKFYGDESKILVTIEEI